MEMIWLFNDAQEHQTCISDHTSGREFEQNLKRYVPSHSGKIIRTPS